MKLQDEIKFLLALYKKLEKVGGTKISVNRSFLEIINMNELAAIISKDAIETICILYEINQKNIEKSPITNVDPCTGNSTRGRC